MAGDSFLLGPAAADRLVVRRVLAALEGAGAGWLRAAGALGEELTTSAKDRAGETAVCDGEREVIEGSKEDFPVYEGENLV